MDNIPGDDCLGSLPTKYNYRNFDNGIGSCPGDVVGISSGITEIFRQFGLNEMISDKILRALCYVYDKFKRNQVDDSICDYLYYWLGDRLINNLKNRYEFNVVIYRLFDIFYKNNNYQFCFPRNTVMDFVYFQKTKLSFDYFKDYDKYILDLAKHNRSCKKNTLITLQYLSIIISSYIKSVLQNIMRINIFVNNFVLIINLRSTMN
ncbi:hypothetical protein PCYB_006690 [Plasmodium cynomolgi strain B]|uniref:CYIR protein n=1 Tax=Plasmodium cynomolgi (strain B) TaxID=1120755 RepID=K6V3H4_PLACD|nr:hypothetical protein PCYB_006690 [Plasmodium cynomolgi strain B]GAB69920.1 hypothetical protein PCYB_006690 [Plasmodium cynomolgi strain B]